MTTVDQMSDEVVIEAAIQLLQQKLRFIRCRSQNVSSEEYRSMRVLDRYRSESERILPLRERFLPIRKVT